MAEKYCMKCMHPLEDTDSLCRHCYTPVEGEVPVHHLKPGSILREKYLIGNALGEGGFGITYIGRDLTLDMPIAVKEFYRAGYSYRDHHYSNDITLTQGGKEAVFEKDMQRLLNEARVLAKFSDEPGIVGVRDFFRENGTAYIVMEYLDGITLKQYIQENGCLSCDQLFEMIDPALKTLSQVHKQGLIHRDISPDNIMVLNNGQVKLLDFGAARDVTGDKSLSVVLKHGFAPEEQYRTKGNQGPWTDVYAMCATVYCCITGVVPMQSLERIYSDELQWPSELGAVISKSQEKVLMQGLQIRTGDRIQTIEDLRRGMREGVVPRRPKADPKIEPTEDVPEQPEPEDGAKKPQSWLKWAMAGLAAALALVLLSLWFKPKTPEPAGVIIQKVGVLQDYGGMAEGSVAQQTWKGVTEFCEQNHLEYHSYQPDADTDEARARLIQEAVRDGCNVVVASGYKYGQALAECQNTYPDIYFVGNAIAPEYFTVNGTEAAIADNTVCLTHAEEQAGYLAGYAAVADGYRELGFLGSQPASSIVRYGAGFAQGANDAAVELGIADQVKLKYGYVSELAQADGEAVADIVRHWYADGMQLIFQVGGDHLSEVISVSREAGGKVIGVDSDRAGWDSCVITSAVKDISKSVFDVLEALNGGGWNGFGGRSITLSLSDGAYIGLPVSEDAWRFDSFTVEQYQRVRDELASGQRVCAARQEPDCSIVVEQHPGDEKAHDYAICVEDLSWGEAQARAAELGGYLVRIETREELEQIIGLIETQGLEDRRFFLGGRRDVGGTAYFWVDQSNRQIGTALNGAGGWEDEIWLPGEPSFASAAAEEYCMEMHYDAEFGWCWNDIVTDLVGMNSVYSGRIGYIMEFESGLPAEWNGQMTTPVETEPPVTTPPETEPPVTTPPQTEPPATVPPETEPPVTAPPQTEPPATVPTETEPPVTAPPETAPPVTTPPETQPPETLPPEPAGIAPGGYSITLSPSTVYLYENFYCTVHPDVTDYTKIVIHAVDPTGAMWDFVINGGNSKELTVTELNLTGTWTIYADVYNEYGVFYGNPGMAAYLEVLPWY